MLELTGWAFALATCTALPSRLAIASEQSAGIKRILYILGGLLGDVGTIGPVAALLLLVFLVSAKHRLSLAVAGLVAVFLVVVTLGQNAATEFRFERGVLPGPIDVREGLGHRDFLTAELPLLLGGRFLFVNILSFGLMAVLCKRAYARLRSRALPRVSGAAVAAFCSIGLLFGSQQANDYCASLHNRDALASPSAVFVSGLVRSGTYDGSPAGVRRLLADAKGSRDDVARGARNMGFPAESADRLERAAAGDCSRHPWRRSLDDASERTPLVDAASALSNALFHDHPDGAPIVFHVSLESMRADDIHAIDERAPAAIAPFLTELYSTFDSAIAFTHAHQSGIRTSQALSAAICGMGALPFNISMSRDLGALPLRCMPDVLVDAGFAAHAFYGHEFVFDDMGTFLRGHHVVLHERDELGSNASPRGVWGGVSDAAVYDAALAHAEATNERSPKSAQYNFVLTLSHHTPYTAPDDFAPASRAAIDDVCRTRGLHEQNCDRLNTLRYADDALKRFIDRLSASKLASRSIVVVAADHTVHRWVPWGSTDTPDGETHIPLAVIVPRATQERAKEAWSRLRELAHTQTISNSDLPALLLALVDQSAAMQSLVPSARWHTLGGQGATSPHYLSVTGHGIAHGIDAHGKVFDVTASGESHATETSMETLRGAGDITNAASHNRAEIAFWGSFLRGYVVKCTGIDERQSLREPHALP